MRLVCCVWAKADRGERAGGVRSGLGANKAVPNGGLGTSDRSFDFHIGLDAHLKDDRLNLLRGIESFGELGVEFCV